jgi:hypothetical protein
MTWKDVTKETPEVGGSYLVVTLNGSRQCSTYCKSEDKWGAQLVTHWMELPDHPA